MQKLFITRVNLKQLIKNLKRDCDEFIAPKVEHLDDIVFGDTRDDGEELLDYAGNSVISPRAFLLPQTEPLFEIRSAKNCDFIPIEDKKKRILYGIRPCDIKALVMMRKFFLDEFVDEPYEQRLEAATLIAIACARPCADQSFCNLMDAGPIAKEGFDLQLIPVAQGYLVEIGAKRGESVINKNKKLFTRTVPEHDREIRKMLNNFAVKIKKIDFRKLARIMQEDKVKTEIWDDLALRCVVCSGCITLCPTCSCFSIADRLNADKGLRLRYCDGCPYAGFTRMAGDNAPFPLHKDHIRRFFEHKLNVDVKRYGRSSCVGCARCIRTCPGNISIKKFIERVSEATTYGAPPPIEKE